LQALRVHREEIKAFESLCLTLDRVGLGLVGCNLGLQLRDLHLELEHLLLERVLLALLLSRGWGRGRRGTRTWDLVALVVSRHSQCVSRTPCKVAWGTKKRLA
jgi:hypothetical protein